MPTELIYILLIINLLSYSIMWFDKGAAIKKNRRVPEKSLFIFALIGGSLGIWLGTQSPLYHKATKSKFTVGIPILLLLQGIVMVTFM